MEEEEKRSVWEIVNIIYRYRVVYNMLSNSPEYFLYYLFLYSFAVVLYLYLDSMICVIVVVVVSVMLRDGRVMSKEHPPRGTWYDAL